jgi:pyruvate formate lyase activating enzyme
MSEKAIIFDIQRASLHDGPGIRTTIFLKGCPLNCLWCHNPESTVAKRQLFFHFDKCTNCGDCAKVCEENVHRFTDGKHSIDYSRCTFCGKCVEACNVSALRIIGSEMTTNEVMREVMTDLDFYKKSGGGMTLSGGEPLLQFAFSMEILKKCKETVVNTCVETSGEISTQKFIQILPYVDVLLFDYKATGFAEHKKYTGVSNERILKNLDLAYHYGVPIILRCPIIPGINDNDLHFMGICEMDKKYPNLKGIEILPYHTMGNSKRISIGFEETLTELQTVPSDVAEKWIELLKNNGCHKAKLG